MPEREVPPTGKLLVLSVLYFAQGLPYGFQGNALGLYMRESGISRTGIGLASALALPWLLKVLWAPFVDRHGSPVFGRRKSWIVPMQLAMALCAMGAAFTPVKTELTLLLVLILMLNFFAATQDIAVDGLAVDILSAKELGLGNAAQVNGYKVGMLVGGSLLVAWSATIGWQGLFFAMAALFGGVMLMAWFYQEAPVSQLEVAAQPAWSEVGRRLKQALTLPGTGIALLAIASYKAGEALADKMFGPFLIDHGYSVETVAVWVGTWGLLASFAGTLCGGLIASRLSLPNAIGLAAAFRALPLLAMWGLGAGAISVAAHTVIPIVMLEHFFAGMLTPCMFAFMMSRVDKRIGATHYTLLACVEVLGKSPSALLSGVLADATNYTTVFGVAALVSIAFLALIPPLKRLPA
ncbi:MAG: MFS transporter [Myxococcaceae bacterium]|nr:MFS transporter [Myxococcaceae bacterium]